MSNQKDYEYVAHSGQHFYVTHQNGVPRYNKVNTPADRFTPLNPGAMGTGQSLYNRSQVIDKAVQDAGG
jgi:hypothetical protein